MRTGQQFYKMQRWHFTGVWLPILKIRQPNHDHENSLERQPFMPRETQSSARPSAMYICPLWGNLIWNEFFKLDLTENNFSLFWVMFYIWFYIYHNVSQFDNTLSFIRLNFTSQIGLYLLQSTLTPSVRYWYKAQLWMDIGALTDKLLVTATIQLWLMKWMKGILLFKLSVINQSAWCK